MSNESLFIIFVCGILIGALALHAYFWSVGRSTKRLLDDFQEKFPGRCPICSFHRYGVMHGHLSPDDPIQEHDCLERRAHAVGSEEKENP